MGTAQIRQYSSSYGNADEGNDKYFHLRRNNKTKEHIHEIVRCLVTVVFEVLLRFGGNTEIGNTEVRQRVLGLRNMFVIEQLYIHRLQWMGYVLRMSDNRLLRRTLFTQPSATWNRNSGGQHIIRNLQLKVQVTWVNRLGTLRPVSSPVRNTK